MNSNRKTIITIVSIVILSIAIVAGLILVQKNQDIREKAAPLTNLSFVSSPVTVVRGQTFTSSVKVVTSTNLITGIDIELTYNPAVIQISQMTPTTAIASFTNLATGQIIKNEINNTTGKARFVAYTFDKTLGMSGTKNLLNIVGTISANSSAGAYQINYGPLTSVAALNEGQNAILSKSPLTINVALPTPTATATPTVTPTPTMTPTATPTVTSTPTILPTATPIVYRDWDVDQDRHVGLLDIGLIIDDYDNQNPVTARADVDHLNGVDIVDIGIVVDHFDEIY